MGFTLPLTVQEMMWAPEGNLFYWNSVPSETMQLCSAYAIRVKMGPKNPKLIGLYFHQDKI